ncbi:uncharacterized protein KZ484_020193 isoform 1-T1 [Pholidichthys leucotaenia]
MRRGPAVPVPQLRRGRRRKTDCYVESALTTKRPRVSTEERFGPAGRGSPATTPCGPSAWLPVPEESQAALSIMPAAGPDAAEWEPDDDLLMPDPGSSQSWMASEPEIRRVLYFIFLLFIFEHFSLSPGEMSQVQPSAASKLVSPGSGAAGDPDPGSAFSPEPSSRVASEELPSLVVLEGPDSTSEVGSGAAPTQAGSDVGSAPAVSDVGSPEAQSGSDVGSAPVVSDVVSPEAQSGSDVGSPEAQSGSDVGSAPVVSDVGSLEAQSGSDVGFAPVVSRSGEGIADPLPSVVGSSRHQFFPMPLPPRPGWAFPSSLRAWWLSDAGQPPEGLPCLFGLLLRPPDPLDFRFGDLVWPPDGLCFLAWGSGRPPELFPSPLVSGMDAGCGETP